MRNDFRITSRVLYVYCIRHGDIHVVGGCSNKRVLSERTGVGYDNLVRVFTRSRRVYYEGVGGVLILKLEVGSIVKGSQSIRLRGKGGKELFQRYVRD